MLFVHREEDAIEFRIKTVANVGVLLPVKVVKRIVFTSMPNRSESHLLRCINPESGSRSCHFVFFLVPISYQHFVQRSFLLLYHLFFLLFPNYFMLSVLRIMQRFSSLIITSSFFPIISLTMSIHIS